MSKESALAAATAPATTPPQTTPATTPAAPGTVPAGNVEQNADSARFARLAQKEAQIVKDREAFKKEQEAFKADRDRALAVVAKANKFEELRKTDNIAAMKELGFSETDIFNMMAALPEPKEPTAEEKAAKAASDAADAKIKAFQDEQIKKAAAEQDARDKTIVANFRSEMGKFIEKNKENYEFCAFHGRAAEDLAYEIIVKGLEESKGAELIDMKEAIEMVENYYEEQDKAMANLKKRQGKPTETPPEGPKQPERTRTVTNGDPNFKPAPVITRTRTISSNRTGVTTANATERRQETHDQKRERLIALIKANGLKK